MKRENDPPFVVVGHVSKPHGTKGEFFVWPLTDHPEAAFEPGVELRIADPAGELPDERFPPVRVEEVRPYRRGFLLRLEGIDDRDRADVLRNRYLIRPFEAVEPLAEDEIFYHQLLGLKVVTRDGTEVGVVREVYGLRPADLLEVRGAERDHLIPFTREIVVEWSVEEGRLVVDPPRGLLEL